MVPDLACFALFLAHDHESAFCRRKIANTASLVIDRASVMAHSVLFLLAKAPNIFINV